MLSNHMTNRDANRGGCAHSCRWNYDLYMGDELISDNDRFQFSSKDLMAVNQLPRLLECADSLKIEGRMKSIHYIATVTKVYRMIIDEYFETGTVKDLEYYKKEIEKAENRLFSHGFLEGMTTIKEQLYNMRSENPTQDFVGIILDYNEETQEALVEVRNHFKPYSTLEAFGPNLRSTQFQIKEIINERGESVDAARHPKEHVYIYSPIKLTKYDMIRLVR
jgi:putative protease